MKSPKKKTSDSSSTQEIADSFVSTEDLQTRLLKAEAYIRAQEETIEKLSQELTRSKQEPSKLATIDSRYFDDEKVIADIQLKQLKEMALTRPLTLEETRKFEIFSKIKNLETLDSKNGGSSGKLPKDVTPSTLLSIASSNIKVKAEE